MTRTKLIAAVCTLAIAVGADSDAWSQETLKVAIPQRGAWDAGVAELGQRGGIFKKHGLNLDILYVQAGPESIQAVIGGSMDIATAAGVSAAVGTFAKGAPIRIIGSEMIGAPDLYWYVPANSPIQKIEDYCAIQAHGEADIDRKYRVDDHADHDGASRCRLRRGTVRSRPRGRGQNPDHCYG
jgi:NitT/TauT family transport system substrate-binding protein